MEDSAAKSAECSGEDMEELESEEEAVTAGGAGRGWNDADDNGREVSRNTDQGAQQLAESPP